MQAAGYRSIIAQIVLMCASGSIWLERRIGTDDARRHTWVVIEHVLLIPRVEAGSGIALATRNMLSERFERDKRSRYPANQYFFNKINNIRSWHWRKDETQYQRLKSQSIDR